MGFSGLIYNAFCGGLWPDHLLRSLQFIYEVKDTPDQIRSDHNAGDNVSYSFREVSGFFNVPYYFVPNEGYEAGPPVYSPYPRRLESLTVCGCNYKASTFSSVKVKSKVNLFNVGSSFSYETGINGSRRCAFYPPPSVSAPFHGYLKL